MKNIYLAGGCFWGVEEYFSLIPGVADATNGYANGHVANPSYEQVCTGETGHAETVRITYDPAVISLNTLVRQLFAIIDPLSANRQGNDVGSQYRTGVYYVDAADEPAIRAEFDAEQAKYDQPIVTELEPLACFYEAEKYHQDYLRKNPGGYCHVNFASLSDVRTKSYKQLAKRKDPAQTWRKPSDAELRKTLNSQQYAITQHAGTERAFTGAYDDFYERGIYVDIVTGQPLFSSADKYDAGCGWPAFSRTVDEDATILRDDRSFGMHRIEVRSSGGNSHLGHMFHDGPAEAGGVRYCINSAALRFVPYAELEAEGLGYLRDRC